MFHVRSKTALKLANTRVFPCKNGIDALLRPEMLSSGRKASTDEKGTHTHTQTRDGSDNHSGNNYDLWIRILQQETPRLPTPFAIPSPASLPTVAKKACTYCARTCAYTRCNVLSVFVFIFISNESTEIKQKQRREYKSINPSGHYMYHQV
jgi:hypothetical protein